MAIGYFLLVGDKTTCGVSWLAHWIVLALVPVGPDLLIL